MKKRIGLIAAVVSLAEVCTSSAQIARPLTVVEDGAGITVSTPAWKLVFERRFNGGPSQWFDRAQDPGELDNLAAASGGGAYTQGVLFDYDVYLGTSGGNAIEHMTTMGSNADDGALQLSVVEATAARVRILQHGHPRLNNGGGPPGDPFRELPLISFDTEWTIYPTGRVNIDFQTNLEPAGAVVDSGPGGASPSISASGTAVTASGGANFLTSGVWAGDTIESAGGGWGPIAVAARTSATSLQLASAVPTGNSLDFTVRRSNIVMETISIHADGDPSIVQQCSDPSTSTWRGGSNGDSIWSLSDFSACGNLVRNQSGGYPPLASDTLLVHWARHRSAGSLLSFFEPWPEATFGAFNDAGFTDISYTQLGRFGVRPAQALHRHFQAQMGSAAGSTLPTLQSVAHATPFWRDYRAPYAEALAGTLATGSEIASHGFDLSHGAYRIAAATCTPSATCREAVIRLDSNLGGRANAEYPAPGIELEGFDWNLPAGDNDVRVEISGDGGSTFRRLAADDFNLTSISDEASVGTGRRVFQYFGSLAGSGALAPAIRFKASSQCSAVPRSGCRSAQRGSLVLRSSPTPAQRTLRWLWAGGLAATATADFGDPRIDTDTSVCIYAGAGQPLVVEASVDAADLFLERPAWRATGSTGYRYRRAGGNADGVKSLLLKSGDIAKGKIVLRAAGGDFDLPLMPLDSSNGIVVQLANSASSTCWETSFSAASIRENSSQRLRAKLP